MESVLKLDDCSLYGAGHDCAVMPANIDDKLFKVFTVKGTDMVISVSGNEYSVKSGEGILVFPYETFKIVSFSNINAGCNYIVFSVDSAKYNDMFGRIKHGSVDGKPLVFTDSHICFAIENVCTELRSGANMYSKELISLLSSQMIVYLLRYFGDRCSGENDSKDANLRVCGQVMSYIDSHIYDMKSLSEVAAEMGYNYSYISTLFRKTCGLTLNSYFKTKRMNEAKKLLQDKKMSVSEIARIMNYSSVYAFSKAFKEHFGASPGHYTGRFPNKE